MEWLYQHSINLATAGLGVLMIAVALSLLRPMETKKRRNNGLILLSVGGLALLVNYFGPYLKLLVSGVFLEPGLTLVVGGFIQIIYSRVESGKATWRPVNIGVVCACVVGFVLIVLSVIFGNIK